MYEKLNINYINKFKKAPSKNVKYLIFRKEKMVERKKGQEITNVLDYEYGIGEFFFENGKMVGYDDNPPLLKGENLEVLLMQLDMLQEVPKQEYVVIEDMPLDENGNQLIKKESRVDYYYKKQLEEENNQRNKITGKDRNE